MKKKARAKEEYHKATSEPVYDEYVGCGDEIEPDLITGIRASLEHQYIYEETIRHRQPNSQWEHGGGSGPMPQRIQRSASMRQPTAPPQLSRIGSMRQSGIRGFMRGLGRRSALDIIDIDPQAYPSQITKQTRIDDAYTKEKKRDIGKAIAKWFNFHKIPANTAQGPYYQSMISSIQKSGTGIQPPTPKEIHGMYLDEEVAELKDWIKSFKRQWDEYGVTLMCDSWIGSTRMSIINFFIYCNRRVVFHKSVNVSEKIQDANYIENIMDTVVEEIGSQYIVQIVTDNEANFKKAGLQLMKKRKTLFWTPCATHCMDLMLKDISELPSVNKCITRAQSITKFIYNNHWIHSLMQKYINGEILRPGVTRFATNFIILKSIQQKKQGLMAMVISQEWSDSRYSRSSDGKKMEKIILSSRFWDVVKEIITGVEPLYVVLRKVDIDKRPQMPYLRHMLITAREEVKKAFKDDFKANQYLQIIDRRIEVYMDQDIYNAAYYLNPAIQFRYSLGMRSDLLSALRNAIYRLLSNTTNAADAIMENRLFLETIGSFSDIVAISCRYNMDPAEWWLQFGGDAPNLRKVAIRVLSQTTTSSGCERNWSTFALIHTKVRNRLSYRRFEKLVYVYYNMQLRLQCAELDKEPKETEIDPIDFQFYNEDSEPMLEWVEAMENLEDPLLDEAGDPQRPSRFIIKAIKEEEAHPRQEEDSPQLERDGRSQTTSSKTTRVTKDTQPSQSSAQRANAKAKAKGKAVTSVAPLGRIESSDETPSQSYSTTRSIQRHGSDVDSSASTDDGGDVGKSMVPSTQFEGDAWTEEQYFTPITQDSDRGTRQGTSQVYTRKGKTVDDFKQMRQSLHNVDTEQSSSYSQSSYYKESYDQQQYGDSWSDFSEQQSGDQFYDTEQQISGKSRNSDIVLHASYQYMPQSYLPQESPQTRVIHDDQTTTITTLMHQWHTMYQYTMSWDQFQDWVQQTYQIDIQIHRIEDPDPLPVESRRSFWW
nr:PREDICTED: uncharacterized protein LOC103994246 [Musa acuminata subsp. malaccensis]XP_018686485.1 PREDICTED: uncharacterized protein LOC103994246 [Musa acuminata subsp. malaccensis]XP_018686486.1 PREDICTED: uncharacterized protein LOC103994246 [Musa acuminata subsp. malaccensis]XP_018686487.1 PREDICTED: uncharacterized protein LOC103994246 [Musa acuminata subsp. malaccensis]